MIVNLQRVSKPKKQIDAREKYLLVLGVSKPATKTLLDAMDSKIQSRIDAAIYTMVIDWDTFHYGAEVCGADFLRLMEFTRTGVFV